MSSTKTRYPGASGGALDSYPPRERWDDWTELDSRAWPKRVERRYMLVPTTCFNCESACGLLAYVDRDTLQVRKYEGNPEHPGSRGRNCAKGPATLNQERDPDRILHPLRRKGDRGGNQWEQVTWDAALDDIGARIRRALPHVPAERIVVAPDCGFKYLPREVAYGKMRAMVEGAALVRAELQKAGKT